MTMSIPDMLPTGAPKPFFDHLLHDVHAIGVKKGRGWIKAFGRIEQHFRPECREDAVITFKRLHGLGLEVVPESQVLCLKCAGPIHAFAC